MVGGHQEDKKKKEGFPLNHYHIQNKRGKNTSSSRFVNFIVNKKRTFVSCVVTCNQIKLIIFLALVSGPLAWAQQSLRLPKQEQIHQLIRFYEEERQFNGNILIAENGKVIYENSIGWENKFSGDALTLETPFYLASIAKSFTSVAIIQLHEQGKLDYNQKIGIYFPELDNFGNRITIKHLLNHTSGLPDYFKLGWAEPGVTNAQIYSKLINNLKSLDFKPGNKYSYNNTGYLLLALIVEKVSGVPYFKFVNDNISEPLEMENTWVHDLRNPGVLQKSRAIGYNKKMKKEDDYHLLTWGDGGMYSTLEDLFLFDKALYTGALVSVESLEEAYTETELNNGAKKDYGYGWVIGNNINGKVVSHTGGLAGFRNYFERQIEVKNTIIILTNNSNEDISKIRNTLVKILDGRPYEMPKN